MHLGEGVDQVEGLLRLGRALDEIDRPVREVLIDVAHRLGGVERIGDGQRTALLAVDHGVVLAQALEGRQPLGVEHQLRVLPLVHVLGVLADHRQEAVELVVADLLRLHPFAFADMPLAGEPGDIAIVAQQLGGADFVGPGVLGRVVAGEQRTRQAAARRKSPGHHRRTRRRAERRRIGGGQLQPLGRKRVDVRRGRADHRTAAEGAGVAVAHVVDEDDQDVRLASGLRLELAQLVERGLLLGWMRNRAGSR